MQIVSSPPRRSRPRTDAPDQVPPYVGAGSDGVLCLKACGDRDYYVHLTHADIFRALEAIRARELVDLAAPEEIARWYDTAKRFLDPDATEEPIE